MPGYRASEGEPWDLVAKRTLGTEKALHLLLWENPELAWRKILLSAGDEVRIPEAPETPLPESLPPWKR